MKLIYILCNFLLVVIKNIFANNQLEFKYNKEKARYNEEKNFLDCNHEPFYERKGVDDDNCKIIKSIEARDEQSDECIYINSLFGINESYNCCNISGILCEDGHITEM